MKASWRGRIDNNPSSADESIFILVDELIING
jgi:hypothetical protein